jgi:hypothetical protein
MDSNNALREGVEAGIQSANQQLYQGNEQVIETARTAGQELANQFRGWAGVASEQPGITAAGTTGTLPPSANARQQVSNPFAPLSPTASAAPGATTRARNGVAPPPWAGATTANELDSFSDVDAAGPVPRTAALERAPVRTDGGWTSVHSSVAPPRLAPPKLINTTEAAPLLSELSSTPPLQPMVGQGGPNFPATISANQPIEHSVLAPSQQSPRIQPPPAAASTTTDWDLGFDGKTVAETTRPAPTGNRYETATITAGSAASGAPDFAKAGQPTIPANNHQPAAQSQASQPAQAVGIGGAFDRSPWPEGTANSQTGVVAQLENGAIGTHVVGPPAATGAGLPLGPPPNGANAGALAPSTAPQNVIVPTLPAATGEQLPWMPLVVVSLALAGSIGANLFLGYSYADARHKYRTLVQKTANKFRRAVAA